MTDLLLESEDVSDTTINRVSDSSESLVTKSNDGIKALVRWNTQEQLGGIACTKHLVNRGKVSRALV